MTNQVKVAILINKLLHIDEREEIRSRDRFNEDGNLYLIGHCRYSTSDLRFNQPIQTNPDLAIVHNGVVTQELPHNWEYLYGYQTETANDSELINRTLEAGLDPQDIWADSSLSVIELRSDKSMKAYRNGKRPLYRTQMHNGTIFTSTKDIAIRAGLPDNQELMDNGGINADLQPSYS